MPFRFISAYSKNVVYFIFLEIQNIKEQKNKINVNFYLFILL
jgi:hypothetical protein